MNGEIETHLARMGRNLPGPHPEATRTAREAAVAATPGRHARLLRVLPNVAVYAAAIAAATLLLIATPDNRTGQQGPAGSSTTPAHTDPTWTTGTRRGTAHTPATYAWASTVGYRDTPAADPPLDTIAAMGPDDVIIWARLGARHSGHTADARMPLELREARDLRCCDSLPPDRWVREAELVADAGGRSLIVRVYSRRPLTTARRSLAQTQLRRLLVVADDRLAAGRLAWSG